MSKISLKFTCVHEYQDSSNWQDGHVSKLAKCLWSVCNIYAQGMIIVFYGQTLYHVGPLSLVV